MSTSHPRPHRAWAQQLLMLLVATCLTILAIGAATEARATQPTATISSATLHSALVTRAADRQTLAHDSSRLHVCLHTRHKQCTSERLALKRSRIKLSAAKRRVLALTARIARIRHGPATARTPGTSGGPHSGSSPSSSAGTSDGAGDSTDGSNANT